jgi:hypothetical protein
MKNMGRSGRGSDVRQRAAVTGTALVALGCLAGPAQATPRTLPFSYPVETLAPDAFEIEQIVDMTPIRILDQSGEHNVARTTLTTEFEYGITPRLEVAVYLQLADLPGGGNEGALRFDGLKQRARYRVSDPLTWPVDVALYGEVAELRNEIELEAKLILQRHLGPLRLVTNLWGERELYHSGRREWVLHPTAGAAYEWGPHFSVGLEGWLLKEFADDEEDEGEDFNGGPHGYLGPTFFAQGAGRGWLSFGAYTRLTDFSRSGRVGDYYGRFWFRLMIGVEL